MTEWHNVLHKFMREKWPRSTTTKLHLVIHNLKI